MGYLSIVGYEEYLNQIDPEAHGYLGNVLDWDNRYGRDVRDIDVLQGSSKLLSGSWKSGSYCLPQNE